MHALRNVLDRVLGKQINEVPFIRNKISTKEELL